MSILDEPPNVNEPSTTSIGARLRAAGPLLAVGGGALTYTALFNPQTAGWFPSCGLRSMSGLWCPGCGMTRAVHHLTRGDIAQAVSYNLLVVPLVIAVVAVAVRYLRAPDRPRPLIGAISLPWAAAAFTMVVAFTVLRNLDPFIVLRGG